MKDRNRLRGLLPLIVTSLTLFASAALLFYLHYYTKYLPFLLSAITLLLPTGMTLLLLLFASDIPDKKRRTPKARKAGETQTEPSSGGEETERKQKKHPRIRRIREFLSKVFSLFRRGLRFAYNHSRTTLRWVTSLAFFSSMAVWFFLMFRRKTSIYKLAFWEPVLLLLLFVVFIILDKWCKHAEPESRFLSSILANLRTALAIGRALCLLLTVVTAIRLLVFYDLQTYLVYLLLAVFCYTAVFLLVSFLARFIRKELSTSPVLAVPLPFVTGAADLGVLSYLENSTGITMRSLWSIRLLKQILPYTVLFIGFLFWISTGFVQIESYQAGAVYRFGELQEETLSPGLHFVFPAPIDKVAVYDTGTVQKITVGYRSSVDSDNVWTASHGESEYKLLLGGGNELVSINLRLEFRISDLHAYLSSSASPVSLLEASAYELVTDRTIVTDLNTLLSVDRDAFSSTFRSDLTEKISRYGLGLEVVSVVLESIHPPIEIADIYQEAISAEIDADRYILEAEAEAAVKLANAEAAYDTAVNQANAEKYTKIAQAKADVAEFMAGVEADNAYSDAYRYYKYLNAIRAAYGNASVVIVGEGIKSENLYFGTIRLAQ